MSVIQFEKVDFEPGKSFKLFSPRLKNTYLWHCHPELELVYVEADAGIRHVGTHVSTYTKSDLVFIGSNLPHLNFDYRVRTEYNQIVVQLRADFLGSAIGLAPELALVNKLFKNAEYGIAFNGDIKTLIGEKLKKLSLLNSLEQLLELISIFQLLASTSDATILNKDLASKNFIIKDKIRMGAVYEYISNSYNKKPNVNIVAEKVSLSTPAFCRYFKRQTNMTFTDFVNQFRIEKAKNLLMQSHNVSETCYAVGFTSLSHFNKLFKAIVGKNPSQFKNCYAEKKDK